MQSDFTEITSELPEQKKIPSVQDFEMERLYEAAQRDDEASDRAQPKARFELKCDIVRRVLKIYLFEPNVDNVTARELKVAAELLARVGPNSWSII
jgi:hypothetical protein